MTTARSGTVGGKAVRVQLAKLGGLRLTFRATGHKSSDGDGRTAEDIRRALAREGKQ